MPLQNLEAIGITDPVENAKQNVIYFNAIEQFKDKVIASPIFLLEDTNCNYLLNLKLLLGNEATTLKTHQKMCKQAKEQNYLKEYVCV